MATCICGHGLALHDGLGECLATEQGTDCSCAEFRDQAIWKPDPAHIVTTKEALEELVRPPLTMRQKEQFEAARPFGKCLRCGNEHHLDPLGIAVRCTAVQQISFNSSGGIGHIEFGIGQQIDHSAALQELNALLDKLDQRVSSVERIAVRDEPTCKCGHGVGNHDSDGRCNQCLCQHFRNIFA